MAFRMSHARTSLFEQDLLANPSIAPRTFFGCLEYVPYARVGFSNTNHTQEHPESYKYMYVFHGIDEPSTHNPRPYDSSGRHSDHLEFGQTEARSLCLSLTFPVLQAAAPPLPFDETTTSQQR